MRLPTKYTHKGYDFLDWAEPQNAYHNGVDFNFGKAYEDLGQAVYPFKAGSVAHKSRRIDGYGNIVVVKHSNNEYSKYAHLDEINCKVGDKVTTFDQIATIGKSGTEKPHLHFEIYDNFISKKGYRFYPVRKPKYFVKKHYKNPNTYIQPTRVNVGIVADDTSWIKTHLKDIQDYFLKHSKDQLKLNFDIKDVSVATKFKENERVDISWFLSNYAQEFGTKDILVYHTNNKDWQSIDFGGYTKNKQYIGKWLIFMHSDKASTSRGFGDIEHEFKGRLIHEICHVLYKMNRKEMPKDEDKHVEHKDNTHFWDYTEKELHNALKEINYDNLTLNPLTSKMFDLIKGDKDEDIFAVGSSGKKHHVPSEAVLEKGKEENLWDDDIKEKPQEVVDEINSSWSFGLFN